MQILQLRFFYLLWSTEGRNIKTLKTTVAIYQGSEIISIETEEQPDQSSLKVKILFSFYQRELSNCWMHQAKTENETSAFQEFESVEGQIDIEVRSHVKLSFN